MVVDRVVDESFLRANATEQLSDTLLASKVEYPLAGGTAPGSTEEGSSSTTMMHYLVCFVDLLCYIQQGF